MPDQITIKNAVKVAEHHLRQLYPQGKIQKARLEEVELSDDGKLWIVTLSFVDPSSSSFSKLIQSDEGREYKIIRVDAKTGAMKSMKIRRRE